MLLKLKINVKNNNIKLLINLYKLLSYFNSYNYGKKLDNAIFLEKNTKNHFKILIKLICINKQVNVYKC
jgi:hypothetical protein